MDSTNQNKAGKSLPRASSGGFSFRNMRLQTRLVLLVLGVSVPILILSLWVLALRSETLIRQHTNQQLELTNDGILLQTNTWFKNNSGILHQMASFDEIVSMDPARQKPALVNTSKAFPSLFLVQTMNTSGVNVARNDDQAPKDYSDRDYFQGAMNGAPVSYQVLVSRTTNKPALNMAAPIRDASGNIIGVMSIVSELKDITQEVLKTGTNPAQEKTVTFIVDAKNQVIAHPELALADQLTDFSAYPPVKALREGRRGIYEYTDPQGRRWLAYLDQMENGWGVITQEEYTVALAPVNEFQAIAFGVIVIAAVLLAVTAFVVIYRALRPVAHLTETVARVSAGDYSQAALVERNDEVGQLAQAFNQMTAQLRDNITNLETRIRQRTQALQLSTEVSRRLSTVLDLNELTHDVVNEIQSVYGYYHVHIYLFDEARENLVMAGGTGDAGRVMLAREHKIFRGRGLVGRAAEMNAPVLVSDTTQDPGWLPNPFLPETRSELAFPIASGDEVMGVLDVQQNKVGGLTQVDVEMVQLVANQVAVALQNARTYTYTQRQAERESQITAIGQKIQQAETIDEALKIAVSGLGLALGARRSSVELRSKEPGSTERSSMEQSSKEQRSSASTPDGKN